MNYILPGFADLSKLFDSVKFSFDVWVILMEACTYTYLFFYIRSVFSFMVIKEEYFDIIS